MKKLLYVLLSIALLASTTACDDNKTIEEPPYENPENSLTWHFLGSVDVLQPDLKTYSHKNVITRVVFNSSHTKCDVFVYDVSFAANMPIQINMEVYGLDVEEVYGGYRITGDNIMPKIGSRDFEAYTIYGFDGLVTTKTMEYKMKCGDGEKYTAYPVSYAAGAYDLKEGDIDENVGGGGSGGSISGGVFAGKMEVEQSNGTVYEQEDTRFEIVFTDENKSTANLIMYDVNFSDKMPFPLDEMLIEGITCVLTPDGYRLSGEGIIPVWNNAGVERYIVTGLEGILSSMGLTVSMMCGSSPLTYSGEITEEGEQ